MHSSFWRRPIPAWARRVLVWLATLIVLIAVAAVSTWVYFHQTYERWLAEPAERLVGHPHRLIVDGQVLYPPVEGELEAIIDTHLRDYPTDHINVVELSRSEILMFSFLGRAYVKVFLHTQLPESDVSRRVEFISLYLRDEGLWRWDAIYNYALE